MKKSVMADKRRLGYLYKHFRESDETGFSTVSGNASDMLIRQNFQTLETAIERHTTSPESDKIRAGLKMKLYYIIRFSQVFEQNENLIFGDAVFSITKSVPSVFA